MDAMGSPTLCDAPTRRPTEPCKHGARYASTMATEAEYDYLVGRLVEKELVSPEDVIILRQVRSAVERGAARKDTCTTVVFLLFCTRKVPFSYHFSSCLPSRAGAEGVSHRARGLPEALRARAPRLWISSYRRLGVF